MALAAASEPASIAVSVFVDGAGEAWPGRRDRTTHDAAAPSATTLNAAATTRVRLQDDVTGGLR